MTATVPIRILVSHADPLAQAGLSSAFQAYPDFQVVAQRPGESRDGVDVVTADFERGIEYLCMTRGTARAARVLIVTTNDRECDIRRALKMGARGYLLQGCSFDELAQAVREAFAGNVHLGASIAQRLAESIYGDALTAREEEVLRHVVEGLCNKEIANRLDLAVGTVKSHLRAVYAKLDVKSRTHAVAVVGRRGLLQMQGGASPKLDYSAGQSGAAAEHVIVGIGA